MKVNSIQIDSYSKNTAGNAVSKNYSILVNGEKYIVNSDANNSVAQNVALKDTSFSGKTTDLAAKKGYAVLINGEKYIVGASKNVINKTGNAKFVVFEVFKKIIPHSNKADKSLNVIA